MPKCNWMSIINFHKLSQVPRSQWRWSKISQVHEAGGFHINDKVVRKLFRNKKKVSIQIFSSYLFGNASYSENACKPANRIHDQNTVISLEGIHGEMWRSSLSKTISRQCHNQNFKHMRRLDLVDTTLITANWAREDTSKSYIVLITAALILFVIRIWKLMLSSLSR